MSEHPTFNPASGDVPVDGICEDCGKSRWEHRDGGAVYGLICPGAARESAPWSEAEHKRQHQLRMQEEDNL